VAALDQATLDLLAEQVEVDMITPRSDGSLSRRPIWAVVVDGEAYVRSYLGERGAWYQRVLADGKASIGLDDRTIDVATEPEHGEEINRKISDAFYAKYSGSSPGPTEAMVSPEVTATTLRLTTA
jgi:hypothetical protein